MRTVVREREGSRADRARVHPFSLLEADLLPIEQLVSFAVREGRRPRPIYTAHKWFARRLGSVFRSLLIGATAASNEDFQRLYYGQADLSGLKVLDPFVGGGTSVFEAARLGADAYGCDVDPVACAVSRLELAATTLPDLSETFATLKDRVGRRLAQYHRRGSELVLHHFWVQEVTCRGCNRPFDAHPNYVLADDGKVRHAFCSSCGTVHELAPGAANLDCSACGTQTTCDQGTVTRGKATCPRCKHGEPLIVKARREGSPKWRIFAVETVRPPEDGRTVPLAKRKFLTASPADQQVYDAASADLRAAEQAGKVLLPDDLIDTSGWSDERLSAYGYKRWRELFNDRQLLHLGLLAKEISLLEQPLRHAMAMAFSDHLTTNCMMASYAAGWRRLTPLFSVRAFRHIQRPVELNPWIECAGRGTFPNSIKKLKAASAYARNPKEPVGEKAFVDVASRARPKRNHVHLGTARNLAFLRDRSVDVVMTDPPYFDNIAYSELARFFGPWLRQLGALDERNQQDILENSLVANRSRQGSVERYVDGLGGAFEEIARVLKRKGIVAFSYRHTDASAWLALAKAIVGTDLHVTKVLPLPGEAGNGLHAQGERGLWDAVFVLRRGAQKNRELKVTRQDVDDVLEEVAGWETRFGSLPLPFNAKDALALRRAALVGKSLSYRRKPARAEWVTLEQALLEY